MILMVVVMVSSVEESISKIASMLKTGGIEVEKYSLNFIKTTMEISFKDILFDVNPFLKER